MNISGLLLLLAFHAEVFDLGAAFASSGLPLSGFGVKKTLVRGLSDARKHELQMALTEVSQSPQPTRSLRTWRKWWMNIRRRFWRGRLAGTPGALLKLQARFRGGYSLGHFVPDAFEFALDRFQLDALQALDEGHSVVVSAPTGSGKTVIAEMGCYLALAREQRIVYTTPLKALSNQKFHDLQRKFGFERVGLMTGDKRINERSPILVMTTEVYRNMLRKLDPKVEPLNADGDTDDFNPLYNVGHVVLDEFHYMNDRQRGTVWEESCILTPSSVQLIALSATIVNAQQIVDWLTAIHGPTKLIKTDARSVPLRYHFADTNGIQQLFDAERAGPGGKRETPGTLQERRQLWKLSEKLTIEGKQSPVFFEYESPSGSSLPSLELNSSILDSPLAFLEALQAESDGRSGRSADDTQDEMQTGDVIDPVVGEPIDQQELVGELEQCRMLPAIVFIFSRIGCDKVARLVSKTNSLLSETELKKVEEYLDAFNAANPEHPLKKELDQWLRNGVASHHAGMLPSEKDLVELLFQEALVKVVFATETLAAGLNMPARCTVITSSSKRGKARQEPLKTSAVLQMAGRAGRRGKDRVGHVVFCRTSSEGPAAFHRLLLREPEPIKSHFSLTYALVLRLLETRELDECQDIVSRSFGSYLYSKESDFIRASFMSSPWEDFQALSKVLRAYGALDEWSVTKFGQLVAELPSDNELWLALVLSDLRDRPKLEPQELAAVLAATLDERVRPRTQIGYAMSPAVREILGALRTTASALRSQQFSNRAFLNFHLMPTVCPIVEVWAAGEDWEVLKHKTSLDDGDIVRILYRTMDLLHTVMSAPGVSALIRWTADQAVRAMNRYPLEESSFSLQIAAPSPPPP